MSWKARIEWLIKAEGSFDVAAVISAQTITGTGATVVNTAKAPVFGGSKRGTARVTMLEGAALLAWDDTTPTEADSLRLALGEPPKEFSIGTGQVLSFAEAAEAAPYTAPSPLLAPGDQTRLPFDFADGTDHIIVPAAAGKKGRLYRLMLTADSEVTLELWNKTSANGGGGTKLHTWRKIRGVTLDNADGRAWWASATAEDLILKCPAGGVNISGTAYYAQSEN